MNNSLYKELSRKLAQDLGGTPFSIGKVGLTHPDLRTKSKLKISDDEGVVQSAQMWYGEALGAEGRICCVLIALDANPDNLEIAYVIGFKDFQGDYQKDGVNIGARYDWSSDSDPGLMVQKIGDKLVPLSLEQRLKLALGFENMVQDGVSWEAFDKVPQELLKFLSEIIESEELE